MAGIQDYQAREHLLTVLKERGIPLGSDDISWAFASAKTRDQSIAWVKEYLQDVTLLTNDELHMLEASRIPPNLVGDPTQQVVVQDQDLKAAIESLQASTAMIEKHSQALEVQRDALLAFQDQGMNRSAPLEVSPRKTLATDASKAQFTVRFPVPCVHHI
jgi:hypothetical protein